MVVRLADDHANARKLALGLSSIPGIRIQPENVRTNIVFFEPPASVPAADFIRKLEDGSVRMYALARGETVMVRAVTSRMVTGDDIDEALSRIEHILT
jgi:threonine aldolase